MFSVRLHNIQKLTLLLLVLIVGPTFGAVLAQDCAPDYAELAQRLSETCDAATPGSACASAGVSLAFMDGTLATTDTALSDIQLADLQKMTLEDPQSLALLHIQHPLIEEEGLTLLALGALELENQVIPVEAVVPVTLNVNILNGINVRNTPSTDSEIIDGLTGGDKVIADGRNEKGTWLRIRLDDGAIGWLAASLVQVEGDIMALQNYEIRANDSTQLSPMQALHLTSHSGCGDAGAGLLVQIPKAWGALEMVINDIPISLRGTAFIQASADELNVSMLDGLGWTTTFDMTIPAGTGLSMTTTPEIPTAILEPYPLDALSGLPLDSLKEKIVLPEPLTQEAIDAQLKGLLPDAGQWKWAWDTSLFKGTCPFLPFFMLPNFGFLPSFDGSRIRLALYMNGRQSAGPWIERTAPSIYSGAEDMVGNGVGEIAFYILSPTAMEWEMGQRMADGESFCIWRGHYEFIPE